MRRNCRKLYLAGGMRPGIGAPVTIALDLTSVLNGIVVAMGAAVVWFLKGIYSDFRTTLATLSREVGEQRTQIAVLNARLDALLAITHRNTDVLDDHSGFLQGLGYRMREELRAARESGSK